MYLFRQGDKHMATPKNKRRYTVTLTPANVDRFHALLDDFGLPPAAMSRAFDETLIDLADALQAGRDEGQLTNEILWRLLGKKKVSMKNEKGAKNVSEQKRNTVLNTKNA